MRKNAEHHRGHDDQLDRFLPWYMCFLPKEDETEHDGSESVRAEPPHEQHGGCTQTGANDGDRHRNHPHRRQAKDGYSAWTRLKRVQARATSRPNKKKTKYTKSWPYPSMHATLSALASLKPTWTAMPAT